MNLDEDTAFQLAADNDVAKHRDALPEQIPNIGLPASSLPLSHSAQGSSGNAPLIGR